jgi:sucrose-6-phosphate hydrolase SacC (GH32 family)
MKKLIFILIVFAIVTLIIITACKHQPSDIVLVNFESDRYGDLIIEGEAFSTGSAKSALPEQTGGRTIEGYVGKSLTNSIVGCVDSKGNITSQSFTIKGKYINFLIAGGLFSGETCINLLIDNELVKTTPNPKEWNRPSGVIKWVTWDVSEWQGKTAVIEIVDRQTGYREFVTVDHIYQSDQNHVNTSYEYNTRRTITFDKQYLNIPIKEGTASQRLSLYIDDQMVREFQVELAEAEPDYWMFLDVSEWQGKEGIIQIAKMTQGSKGLESIFVDTTVVDFDHLYREKDRPQFHFTSRRGWHNDPNGLVYYKGEYHLFYQHNPLGWSWGNMTWGHAISTDLIQWEEMAPAIYPDEMGTEFSGSGVIDWNNTARFQEGDEKALVLIYTAAGGTSVWSEDKTFTQCIAYSTDKGRTWTKYSGNPVLKHIIGRNRDPKVVWYEPDKKWVMALYLEGNNFGLFTSDDLKSWTQIQEIIIEEGAECPDFFEIPLDGDTKKMKWVLTAANGRFLMGSFNGKQFTPETESYPSEWGKNYYAVQSYSDIQDGRRIQVGWMAGSEFKGMAFNQQFAIPRELTLKTTREGIRLYGVPVREIENIHGEKQSWNNVTVKHEDNPLSELHGELYHIISEFMISENSEVEFGFNLRGFEIKYNTQNNMLTAHRPTDNAVSEIKLLPENGKIRLEILLDMASVEVYANNGLVPMAFFYIPEDRNAKLSLLSNNGNFVLNSMEVYKLKSIWQQNLV